MQINVKRTKVKTLFLLANISCVNNTYLRCCRVSDVLIVKEINYCSLIIFSSDFKAIFCFYYQYFMIFFLFKYHVLILKISNTRSRFSKICTNFDLSYDYWITYPIMHLINSKPKGSSLLTTL